MPLSQNKPEIQSRQLADKVVGIIHAKSSSVKMQVHLDQSQSLFYF